MDLSAREIDNSLIERAKGGDEAAFGVLIAKYDGAVRSYLRALCSSSSYGDDLTQETFIKAYLNISKYSDKYPLVVWFKAIGHNLFIDYLRREKKSQPTSHIAFDDVSDSPEELYILLQRSELIEQKLASLPELYQEIIDLRYFKSLSYLEICERLGTPIGTVKTRLYRAKQILIELLESVD